MTIISLEKLLNSDACGNLEKLVQNAQHMDELTSALQRDLEPNMAANLLAASVREDGEMVLIARSPEWASRLRYEAERLMITARTTGLEVKGYRITVGRAG